MNRVLIGGRERVERRRKPPAQITVALSMDCPSLRVTPLSVSAETPTPERWRLRFRLCFVRTNLKMLQWSALPAHRSGLLVVTASKLLLGRGFRLPWLN